MLHIMLMIFIATGTYTHYKAECSSHHVENTFLCMRLNSKDLTPMMTDKDDRQKDEKCQSRDFLSTNVGTREIMNKKKLLLYGTCMAERYPNILEEYSEGRIALAVCLERDHMNMVAFKLATMIKTAKLEEIVVLTVDGSPHCVQLHQTVSEVNRLFKKPPPTRYLVVEHGNLHEIDAKVVKTSRFLSKISNLLKKESK